MGHFKGSVACKEKKPVGDEKVNEKVRHVEEVDNEGSQTDTSDGSVEESKVKKNKIPA